MYDDYDCYVDSDQPGGGKLFLLLLFTLFEKCVKKDTTFGKYTFNVFSQKGTFLI